MMNRVKLFMELHQKGELPWSRFSPGALLDLRTPLTSALIKEKKGGGEVIRVADPEAFGKWLRHTHPGIFGDFTANSPRASNIVMNRNSKQGKQALQHFTVLARAHCIGPHLDHKAHAGITSLVEATRNWGAAGIVLEILDSEEGVRGPLLPAGSRVMTVENMENFYNTERWNTEADLFLFAGNGGRMRGKFIDWLVLQKEINVIHFGDFDPVGIQEFSRLLAKMPNRVSLFTPKGIEDLFHKFSNRTILEKKKNREILAGLARGLHPFIDRVLDLIAIHGPLEQEAMLVDLGASSLNQTPPPV